MATNKAMKKEQKRKTVVLSVLWNKVFASVLLMGVYAVGSDVSFPFQP